MSKEEDDSVAYGGLVKAPKVLADIVESVAGAVYIDVNFDLQTLWVVCVYLFSKPIDVVLLSLFQILSYMVLKVKGFLLSICRFSVVFWNP